MKKYVLLQPNGRWEWNEVESFTLPFMQASVGGYLEALTVSDEVVAWLNEEGKLQGLPVNGTATALCDDANVGLAYDDIIVGPVLFTGGPDSEGDTQGLSDKALDWLSDALRKAATS